MKFIRIILLCIITGALLLAAGCSRQTPKENLDSFISLWQKGDYASMYSLLSKESKDQINEADFSEQYKTIYDKIKASNIKITPTYPKKFTTDKNGEAVIPIDITMDTLAGNIKLSETAILVEEKVNNKKNWFIKWSKDMIYPGLASGDNIKVKKLAAKRGEIYDRNGNGLAINGSAASVGIVPEKLTGNKNDSITQIAKILYMTPGQIKNKLQASWVKPNFFVPIAEIPNTARSQKDELLKISGVMITDTPSRVYPYGEAAAQLIGYIDAGTGEGKTGLERIFNDRLSARNGYDIYLQDSSGDTLKIIAEKKPQNGENIKLTIDANLQSSIYNELKNDTGTGIALNPKTGEVLAMVSTPSYDPNLCVLGYPTSLYNALASNPGDPFTAKFASTFAPGSTFKVVTSSLGITKGTLKPDATVTIDGPKWQPNSSWGNDYITRVDSNVSKLNLNTALIYSDNIYFAQAALNIGIQDFTNGAIKFGIGDNIPFPFPLKSSQIGDNNKINSERLLADTGYGQAQVLINPLQLGLIYSTFLNNGNIPLPILEVGAKQGIWKQDVISPDVANRVLEGLIQVVNSPLGPCYRDARIPGMTIAGKTGTAEIHSSSNKNDEEQLGWFVGFNTKDPQLMVVMMAENVQGRGESHYVVPKVKSVMQEYFNGN